MALEIRTHVSEWGLRIAGLAPLAALYFLLPARNHTEAEDSIPYIMRVTEGAPALHPNHLLFEPVGSLALAIFRMFGHQGSAEIPMQVLNTLGALAALLAATHLVASRALSGGATPARATLAGLLTAYAIGVCFGFWHYATEAETYLLPFAFASVALALFAGAPIGASRAAGLGLAIAAAILLHQKFVFFGALAGLWLLFSHLRGKSGQRFFPVLLYAILSVGPVLIAYFYAYSINPDPGVPGFLSWARGYASDGLWDPPSAFTPVKAVVGLGSSIVTLNAFFSLPGFADALSALFAGKILLEERYLAETFIPLLAGLMILASFVLAALLAAFAIFRAWRTGFQAWTAFDRFLLLYILVYTLLVSIWEPFNREFWIHIVAVTLILFGRRARWHEARISSIWGLVIALLFAGNLVGAILPMSSRASDYWYASNERLITALAPGDVIISDCGWICGNYLTFYGGAAVLAPSFNTPEHLNTVIDERSEGRALYLSSWAISPPEGLFIASEPGTREAFLAALEASYAPLPVLDPGEAGARTQRFWRREEAAWVLVE